MQQARAGNFFAPENTTPLRYFTKKFPGLFDMSLQNENNVDCIRV